MVLLTLVYIKEQWHYNVSEAKLAFSGIYFPPKTLADYFLLAGYLKALAKNHNM